MHSEINLANRRLEKSNERKLIKKTDFLEKISIFEFRRKKLMPFKLFKFLKQFMTLF